MQRKGNHAGIRVRHGRGCPTPTDGGCRCQPRYEAWVFSPRDNKKLRKSFPTLAAAKSWRADATVALRRGELRAVTPITLKEAAEAWLKGVEQGTIRTRAGDWYKPSTRRGYETALRDCLLPEFGQVKLADLQRIDLQDLAERLLGQGLSASAIRNTLMPLRVIYRRALSRGQVTVDPTLGLELPAVRGSRDRIATPAEAANLIAALPEADRALWATALYAGLRRGELQALRWEDINLDAAIIRVERAWDDKARLYVEPKSRAGNRTVPIATVLRAHLIQHRLRTGRCTGLVFPSPSRQPFTASNARRRAHTAWKHTKLTPIAFHEARHTYASLMIAAGANAKALSSYMGHASVTTTYDRYGHLMPGNEREAVKLLDSYLENAKSR